ncbi:transketolase [Rhodopseudomonas sp. P2A-2r]|uniref:transketolase family protein n=1 Tax=Rhodopseudomonas sp. P2A-2r TaxID=2991972 RepID=UPI002234E196|nr:transketolase [Rhodopseudomonas sp. P2A-2r]UZE48082.1 transketolase [Rhodopseudomonas sp. P2A-2r]
MALEPLQSAMGERFINCGVAEQNMITVAAALSHEGLEPWTYTIAPFCYARAFEQIRNDVCIHGLPVKLLGNGGGYGYGVMGPTHHALEDYGILLTLPKMKVFVPAFTEDVKETVSSAGDFTGPAYIRLGRGEKPMGATVPDYAPWRLLLNGDAGVMIVVGPLAGPAWGALQDMSVSERPALWVVTELPIHANPPPPALVEMLKRTRRLVIVEEHVAQGGVGQQMCQWVMEGGIAVDHFRHLYAKGYPSGTYGSQAFLRAQSGLDPQNIAFEAKALTN